jgi:hypothetical protein
MQEKPLPVPTLIVQNDRVWSRVTRRATASDPAEIGRISRQTAEWQRVWGHDSVKCQYRKLFLAHPEDVRAGLTVQNRQIARVAHAKGISRQ